MNYKITDLGKIGSPRIVSSYYHMLEPSAQASVITDKLKLNVSFISRYLNVLSEMRDYIISQSYDDPYWDPGLIGGQDFTNYMLSKIEENQLIPETSVVMCGHSFGTVAGSIISYCRTVGNSLNSWDIDTVYDTEFVSNMNSATIPATKENGTSINVPVNQFIDTLSNSLVMSDVYSEILSNYGADPIQVKDYLINELTTKYDSSSNIVNSAVSFVSSNVSELYSATSKNEMLIGLLGGVFDDYSDADQWISEHDQFALSDIDWNLYTGKGLLYTLWNTFSSGLYKVVDIVNDGFKVAASIIQSLFILASKALDTISVGLFNWMANTLNPLDYVITDSKSDNYTFTNMFTVPIMNVSTEDYVLHKIKVAEMTPANGWLSETAKLGTLTYLKNNFIGTYSANDYLSVNTIKIRDYEYDSTNNALYAYVLYKSQIKPIFFPLDILFDNNILTLGELASDGITKAVHFNNPDTAFKDLCLILQGVGLHEVQQRTKIMLDKPDLNTTSEKMMGLCLSTSLMCRQLLKDAYSKLDISNLVWKDHGNDKIMAQTNAGFMTKSWALKLFGSGGGASNKDIAYMVSSVKSSSLQDPYMNLGESYYVPGRSDYINVQSSEDEYYYIIEDYFLNYAKLITAPWSFNNVPSSDLSLLNKLPNATSQDATSRYSLLTDDNIASNAVGRVLQATIIIGSIALVSYGMYRVVNARKIAYKRNLDALKTLSEQLANPNSDKTVSYKQMRRINTMLSNGGNPSVILNTASSSDDLQAILNTMESLKSIIK